MANSKWLPLDGESASDYMARLLPFFMRMGSDIMPDGYFGTAIDGSTVPSPNLFFTGTAIDIFNNSIRPWIIAMWGWFSDYLLGVQGVNAQEWFDNQDFPLSDCPTL